MVALENDRMNMVDCEAKYLGGKWSSGLSSHNGQAQMKGTEQQCEVIIMIHASGVAKVSGYIPPCTMNFDLWSLTWCFR